MYSGYAVFRPRLDWPPAVTPALLDGVVKLTERGEIEEIESEIRARAVEALDALFPLTIVYDCDCGEGAP